MGKVIYSMNVSLDGYVADANGGLGWGSIDDEIHTWWGDRIREVDAFVYGRRLYETMAAYWPTAEHDPNATGPMLEFGRIWNPKPKIVFSTSLAKVSWNSRLATGDVGDEFARLQSEFEGDLTVGGPELAASFIRRGLVDEYGLVVHPVVLGGGLPFFPNLEMPVGLRLIDTKRFESGVVYLRYAAM